MQDGSQSVAGAGAEGYGHAVPDDCTPDILGMQIFGLHIQQAAPQHALCNSVCKPDGLHDSDIGAQPDSQIADFRYAECDRHHTPGLIVFGEPGIEQLSCGVAKKEEGATETVYGFAFKDGNLIQEEPYLFTATYQSNSVKLKSTDGYTATLPSTEECDTILM